MAFPHRLMIVLVVAILLGSAGCAGRQAETAGEKATPKALFQEKCSFCHGLNLALEQSHTLAGWQELVKKEAGRRIWFINSSEQEIIARYLFEVAPAEKEAPPQKDRSGVNEHDRPEYDRN